jgi:hypothetical protein
MGLVNNVQVGSFQDPKGKEEFPNWIRFWDGEYMRELTGETKVSAEGTHISIKIGDEKSYDLRKF